MKHRPNNKFRGKRSGKPHGKPHGRPERREERGETRPAAKSFQKPAPARRDQPEKPKARKFNIDLFGMHAVKEAWANPARHVHALYISDAEMRNLDSGGLKRPTPTIVSKEELDRSLPSGSVHQGIAMSCQPLEEVSVEDFIVRAESKTRDILVMLDQVTDPHNVGAILRSACAFGAGGVIVQRKHAPELTGVLAKTASGAVEHMPVAYEVNLTRTLEVLKDAGYAAIGLDERGEI